MQNERSWECSVESEVPTVRFGDYLVTCRVRRVEVKVESEAQTVVLGDCLMACRVRCVESEMWHPKPKV